MAVFYFVIFKKYHNSCRDFASMIQKGVDQSMIELKNVKQIGTPRENNKIYIENTTYNKIKEDSYLEKRVFVLMGHTERMGEKYATFIEAAIPVRDIEFSGGVPKWNNGIWSGVFREIKRLYENMIIVGWAVDIKGMSPKLTPDLERVHREHFGGVHQLLLLMDSLEQEETFYIYKDNKVELKDGFYIYHKARSKERIPVTVLPEKESKPRRFEPEVEVEVEMSEPQERPSGRYRQMIQEKKTPQKDNGNVGVAIAVAMLIFVLGVGVYENSDAIQTGLLQNQNATEVSGEEMKETETEVSGNVVEIEVVPGSE